MEGRIILFRRFTKAISCDIMQVGLKNTGCFPHKKTLCRRRNEKPRGNCKSSSTREMTMGGFATGRRFPFMDGA